MNKEHWMADAVKPENKGKFSAKAAKAGKSTAEYASEKASAPGTLGKEARLAQTFEKFGKAKGGTVKSNDSKGNAKESKKAESEENSGAGGRTRASNAEKKEGYYTGGMIPRGSGVAIKGRKFCGTF